MTNETIKTIVVLLLTTAVAVFTWYDKIPGEAFTALVSAVLMWYFNNRKITKLRKDNQTLISKLNEISIQSKTTQDEVKPQL